MQLEDGYLIVLPRTEAKAFFGHRDDVARLDFVNEMLSSDTTQSLSLDRNWPSLHKVLSDISLGDSVLDQCLLGGRRMHQAEDIHLCLVRPDVVGFIAQQGTQVEDSHIENDALEQIRAILNLYEQCAKIGGAMLFVAKQDG